MEPRIQYTKTSDGVNIAYAEAGSGPTVLIVPLPGFSHAQLLWQSSVTEPFRALAESYHIVWYDARGTGLSHRQQHDFSIETMLRDLEAVVSAAKLDSFGIYARVDAVPVAIAYAASPGSKASNVILVDGWATFSDYADTAAYKAEAALRDQDWTFYTESIARVLSGIDNDEAGKSLAQTVRETISPETMRAYQVAHESYDVAGLLSKVNVPTLVVRNTDDRWSPPNASQRLAAEIPSARLILSDDFQNRNLRELVDEAFDRPAADATLHVTPQRPSGGFATILFTDMESSTTLTQQLGDAGAQEVRRAHNDIVRGALAAHGGSEIKHTGDGIMASFTSASSALSAAIAIQRGVAARKEASPDLPLGVYVGLNAGEPIAEDNDLYGTSVDLAARLCDHAEPGQIVAADVVRQLAAGKDFMFSDLGETELRGFEEPMKLWEVRWTEE